MLLAGRTGDAAKPPPVLRTSPTMPPNVSSAPSRNPVLKELEMGSSASIHCLSNYVCAPLMGHGINLACCTGVGKGSFTSCE